MSLIQNVCTAHALRAICDAWTMGVGASLQSGEVTLRACAHSCLRMHEVSQHPRAYAFVYKSKCNEIGLNAYTLSRTLRDGVVAHCGRHGGRRR